MNNQIIEILKSKPHNPHYLNRYIKFINGCQIANLNLSLNEYTETHHILPKAKELFPEYKDLRKNKWNSVRLTARQHIIAHIILWKVYGGTSFLPLYYMLINNNNPSKRKESIKVYQINSHFLSKLKELHSNFRKGKGIYKDTFGNKYLLHKNDPKIQELNLVGNISGFKFSEESKQVMSFRKKHQQLYFLDSKVSLKIDSPHFYDKLYEYESQGWVTEKTFFDKEYCQKQVSQNRKEVHNKNSKRLKGKMRYTDQNGVFVGWFLKSDPQIQELNLIPQKSNLSENKRQEIIKKATEAKLGSITYNNGIVEVKRKEHPGEGWIIGRLPRTASHLSNQKEGLRKARLGKQVWNDGNRNYYILPSETPHPNWIRGMKPRSS